MSHAVAANAERGVWKQGLLWLLFLGPFFFASYGFATWYSAQLPTVGSVVYDWERLIPLWPWSIVPYWSIDIFYGISLLICSTRRELNAHAKRLLSAQVIAVSCFLLFPLSFSVPRPELDGMFGLLFEWLGAFDQPFNQAPSLHIALLVILWVSFAAHLQGLWRWLLHIWFALIGVSVLTTWQHHFIDLPTGALLGWLCVWLWPNDRPSPLTSGTLAKDATRWRLALRYAAGALLFALPAGFFGGAALWLLWPSIALLMVALNYAYFGSAGFQKGLDGRLSSAARWLFAPYLAAAWLNSRLWTRKQPAAVEVLDGVWLGRLPTRQQLANSPFHSVVDLCAELSASPTQQHYYSFPVLDLTVPEAEICLAAAEAISHTQLQRPTLVCCALGYSRSASAIAAWLLYSEHCATLEQALQCLRRARPQIVLKDAHLEKLRQFATSASATGEMHAP